MITAARKQPDDLLDQVGALARAVVAPDLHVVISMGDRDLTRGRVPLGHDRWETVVKAMPPGPRGAVPVLARQTGAEVAIDAGAEILVFLDADCLPSRHLVGRYRDALTTLPDDVPTILCGLLVDPGPRPDAGYVWAELDELVASAPSTTALPAGAVEAEPDLSRFRSASFAVTTEHLRRLGGVVGRGGRAGDHDLDLASRLRAAGGRLAWLGGVTALRRPRSVEDISGPELATLARAASRYEQRWEQELSMPVLSAAQRTGLLRRDDSGQWVPTGRA